MITTEPNPKPDETDITQRPSSYVPSETDAKEINEGHQILMNDLANFAAESVPKAIYLGEKLEKIKKALGHNHWEQWVKNNLDFDVRTARRYMARAKAKRTGVSDLKACTDLMDTGAGGDIEDKPTNKPALKLFSSAAVKVLNQPIEAISAEDKITILRDFERLEPIAIQLFEQPSVFALTWQKKLLEPPVRWARKDVAQLKKDIGKAQEILATIEEDAQFDAGSTTDEDSKTEESATLEGDAP